MIDARPSIHRHGKPRFVCGQRLCGALDCPTCNPQGYEESQDGPAISTDHIYPPIPDRSFDWLATLEDHDIDGPQGFGKTEAEAIAELKEQLTEE